MLEGSLFLYWRGDAATLARPLRWVGLKVVLPQDEHTAFEVRSSFHAPSIVSIADAEMLEVPLEEGSVGYTQQGRLRVVAHTSQATPRDGVHRPGTPVHRLWWTPTGALLVATTLTEQPWDEPLAELDPSTFERTRVHAHLSCAATCGGAHWLPDGRLLTAWNDFDGGEQLLRVMEDGEHECFRVALQDAKNLGLFGVNAAGTLLAHPTRASVVLRQVGPPRTAMKPTKKGVVVRRRSKQTAAPEPWSQVASLSVPSAAYPSVAFAPDGASVLRTHDAESHLHCYDVDGGAERWSADLNPKHEGRANARSLHYYAPGRRVAVAVRAYHRAAEGEGRFSFHALILDAATGRSAQAELDRALVGATSVAFADDERLFVGRADGRVQCLDAHGEVIAEAAAFEHGAVAAVALAGCDRIAVGSDRGELAVLTFDG